MGAVERFDVIVIGAGPAGSTAAYRLAAGGAKVALLDKARFPRDKPCGGGITVRGLQHLPIDVTPVVEDRVTQVELGFGYRERFTRSSDEPLVLMTQRRRLDAHLAEQASAKGADFRDGVRVRSIELDAHGAIVATDTERIAARVVIGADGCNGVSAKALGLAGGVTYGVAYEGNAPWGAIDEERWRSRIWVEFDSVPGGYAWIFPKGDHANLGVGGWTSEGPRLREHLTRLCREAGVDPSAIENVRGYRLPLRRPAARVAQGPALVIGDAAGLVDPMSGDGMYEAFLSSRLASDAAMDLLAGNTTSLDGFQAKLDGALSRHRAISWAGKLLFEQAPGLASRIARSERLWPKVVRRVRGESGGLHGPGSARLEAVSRAIYRPGRR
jgi:geranylgeranyl reductase family protein